MAKTDLQIQSESGQLWIDLVPWRDAAVTAVAAERDAALAKLADITEFIANPVATIEGAREELEKSDKARKRAAIRAELDKLDADKAKKQVELDELDAKAGGPKK